jgi:hypothetical protein
MAEMKAALSRNEFPDTIPKRLRASDEFIG